MLDKIHWDDKESTAHEVDDNESEHGVNIPDEVTELLHVIDKLLDGSFSTRPFPIPNNLDVVSQPVIACITGNT
jgi:hypothetical protein